MSRPFSLEHLRAPCFLTLGIREALSPVRSLGRIPLLLAEVFLPRVDPTAASLPPCPGRAELSCCDRLPPPCLWRPLPRSCSDFFLWSICSFEAAWPALTFKTLFPRHCYLPSAAASRERFSVVLNIRSPFSAAAFPIPPTADNLHPTLPLRCSFESSLSESVFCLHPPEDAAAVSHRTVSDPQARGPLTQPRPPFPSATLGFSPVFLGTHPSSAEETVPRGRKEVWVFLAPPALHLGLSASHPQRPGICRPVPWCPQLGWPRALASLQCVSLPVWS